MGREFLVYQYPYVLYALLIVCAVLLIANAPVLLRELRGTLSRRSGIALGVLFVAALLLRLYAVPHNHQVYYGHVASPRRSQPPNP